MTHPAPIAIIDDDPSVRAAAESLVRSMGHEVACFASAEDFLAAEAGGRRFACVLADVHLPGEDGMRLPGRLAGRVPVILMTGRRDPGLAERARAGGARHLLFKPFADAALAACLAAALAP